MKELVKKLLTTPLGTDESLVSMLFVSIAGSTLLWWGNGEPFFGRREYFLLFIVYWFSPAAYVIYLIAIRAKEKRKSSQLSANARP